MLHYMVLFTTSSAIIHHNIPCFWHNIVPTKHSRSGHIAWCHENHGFKNKDGAKIEWYGVAGDK